ncbi:MAG: NAD(P)H-hydrate dehydratase [Acidobacteria bacterium]|nr:NAD(P)H-hydrate dehydratase [Acidobacteriota bacterium]
MQKVLTAEEIREVDRLTTEKYGIPSILLMENAAHAAARVIGEKLGNSVTGKSFLILCGKGNNGGDGAALARILWTQGAQVFVYLFGNIAETRGDARINFDILKKISGSKEWISRNKNCLFLAEIETAQELALILMLGKKHILIDAFFGTGLSKPVKGELEHFFMTIRRPLNDKKNSLLFSLDLPSGLSADFAKPIGLNVQADVTITFTAPKLANILPPASNFNGKLITVDIGSPYELIENSPSQLFLAERIDAQSWLERTKFSSASYKNQRGRALIVAGSKKMAGAAVLAANAAMVSGLGLVRIATPKSARDAVASRTAPETLIAGVAETKNGAISHAALKEVFELTEKADVVAIGSGLSSDEESTKKFVREFVKKRKFPVLIDADGLNALSPFDLKGSDEFPLILTPHIGEMQRLLGIDEKADLSDRVKMVREFAGKNHVILVLKGERNLIAAPDGRVVISPTGNSGLGKAGNGDTLAGIITGFLAQAVGMKVDIFESVVAALYIAGLAGDIAAEKFGKRVMTASDVRECLVEAFKGLEEN